MILSYIITDRGSPSLNHFMIGSGVPSAEQSRKNSFDILRVVWDPLILFDSDLRGDIC